MDSTEVDTFHWNNVKQFVNNFLMLQIEIRNPLFVHLGSSRDQSFYRARICSRQKNGKWLLQIIAIAFNKIVANYLFVHLTYSLYALFKFS